MAKKRFWHLKSISCVDHRPLDYVSAIAAHTYMWWCLTMHICFDNVGFFLFFFKNIFCFTEHSGWTFCTYYLHVFRNVKKNPWNYDYMQLFANILLSLWKKNGIFTAVLILTSDLNSFTKTNCQQVRNKCWGDLNYKWQSTHSLLIYVSST